MSAQGPLVFGFGAWGLIINSTDLGARYGKKESAEDTPRQGDEDHDEGGNSVGGEYAREPWNIA